MAPKRRRAATPHRAAKVSRGDREDRGIPTPAKCPPVPEPCDQRRKNTTASSTTVTAVVELPVTTAGPLQYPAPGDDDADSSCSNSSFYTSTTLSYSSSSSSDEEVETMRCSVNREEHSDSLDGASSYSSVIQPGDSCCRATPAATLAVLLEVATARNGPVNSTTVEKGAPIHQLPQPNATAGKPRASTVPDAQEETAVISPPVLQ
ncbi:hypothetical protein MTO96_007575 [Rhipicephalus appendiculatus]